MMDVTYIDNTVYMKIKPKTNAVGDINIRLLPAPDATVYYDIGKQKIFS